MDLSHISTEDLLALRQNDLSKVSTKGLQELKNQQLINSERTRLQSELAAEQNPFEAGVIGAGRAAMQLGRGIMDLIGMQAKPDQVEEQAYQALQEQHPIASAVGESVPYLAGGLGAGAALRGLGLAANLGGQAATGAGLGYTEYAPTQGERLTNAAVEGILGLGGEALGRTASRLIGGLGMRPAGGGAMESVGRAQDLGYRVLPSSVSESGTLRNILEGGLESTPGGALVFDKLANDNQALLNVSAARAIGEFDATAPTDEVLNNAFVRIGGEFDRIMSDQVNVPVSDDLISNVIRIDEDRITPMLVGPQDPTRHLVHRTLDLLESGLQRGGLRASEIQVHQSMLGKAAWAQRLANPELSHALGEMQDALLGEATRALPDADRLALERARLQYKNLMSISAGNNVNEVTGDVSAAGVARYLKRRDPVGYGRGRNRNPFYEGVRFMAKTQPPLKSSGTAERTAIRDIMKSAGIGGGAGFAGGQDWETAATGGGAGILFSAVAPNAMARAYLSPLMRNWLTREWGAVGQQASRGAGIGGANILFSIMDSKEQAERATAVINQIGSDQGGGW